MEIKSITSISPVQDFRLDGGIFYKEFLAVQTFKITIAYDGTDFHGWQIQPEDITITSCMQDAFSNVFGEKINIVGASRTDSGVHALGQMARFRSDINIDLQKLISAWNDKLPNSILIRKIEKVDQSFHPCTNVYQKTYWYHLFLKKPLPFVFRYGWFYRFINKIDLKKFEKALQLYIGKHDFASFCKVEEPEKETVRKIDSIKLHKIPRFGVLQVRIKGKSFLRFQIRRMIGYALDVASRKEYSLGYLKDLLNNPNPQQQLLKADGCGLCLRKVKYKDEIIT